MNLVNLTPHEITLADASGEIVRTIPSVGSARIATTQQVVGEVDGFPVNQTTYGAIEGLPDPAPETVYIVSLVVAQKAADRTDVVAPDSGPSAVRYAKDHPRAGQIVAVRGFVKA